MELNTASAVISLARKMEEDGIQLYESLARRYLQDKDTLLSFVRENRRNVTQVERVYYGVISDALEGCFSFKMNPDDYVFETKLREAMVYSGALQQALAMESKIVRFYSDAAQQSRSLLADVSRVFVMVAKKRDERCSQLKSLHDKSC
jgi:rubrerythrin